MRDFPPDAREGKGASWRGGPRVTILLTWAVWNNGKNDDRAQLLKGFNAPSMGI